MTRSYSLQHSSQFCNIYCGLCFRLLGWGGEGRSPPRPRSHIMVHKDKECRTYRRSQPVHSLNSVALVRGACCNNMDRLYVSMGCGKDKQ